MGHQGAQGSLCSPVDVIQIKTSGKAGGFDCGILFFKRAQQVLACKENRRKIRYDVCYAREDA